MALTPKAGIVDKPLKPDTTSSDYDFMAPYWTKVDTFKGGEAAMKDAGRLYLPRFPNETLPDYKYRLATAKFTNIYSDILANIAAKPFAEELMLEQGASDKLVELCADIDGRGNDIHNFGYETFYDGIDRAVDYIFVDFSKAAPRDDGLPLSREDERAQGLRPYWLHIPAPSMIAVHSDFLGGKEVFFHIRWIETTVSMVGYDEVVIERIREYNREPQLDAVGNIKGYGPVQFVVWERQSFAKGLRRQTSWTAVEQGQLTLPIIPIVPFATGKRIDRSWRFVPALMGAVDLQIKLYQAETALWNIKEFTAFPMIAGNGVQPEEKGGVIIPISVGPRSVLYAPPQPGQSTSTSGEWKFIEPSAQSLTFLASEIEAIKKDLRELGRQPLTADSENLTVVTTAFAAQKGNNSIQSWALGLKVALERALAITCLWLKLDESPNLAWNLDDLNIDAATDKGPEILTTARTNGDLTQPTYWKELKRRNILSSDFDEAAEEKGIEEEKKAKLKEQVDLANATTPDITPGSVDPKVTPPRSIPQPPTKK
jgi:hypothetical protein